MPRLQKPTPSSFLTGEYLRRKAGAALINMIKFQITFTSHNLLAIILGQFAQISKILFSHRSCHGFLMSEHIYYPQLPSVHPIQDSKMVLRPYLTEEQPSNVAILLMGLTGSGKSTLISLLTDQSVQVGHSLDSCNSNSGLS
jgi:Cdc6-like AAA superfamily ATPase